MWLHGHLKAKRPGLITPAPKTVTFTLKVFMFGCRGLIFEATGLVPKNSFSNGKLVENDEMS